MKAGENEKAAGVRERAWNSSEARRCEYGRIDRRRGGSINERRGDRAPPFFPALRGWKPKVCNDRARTSWPDRRTTSRRGLIKLQSRLLPPFHFSNPSSPLPLLFGQPAFFLRGASSSPWRGSFPSGTILMRDIISFLYYWTKANLLTRYHSGLAARERADRGKGSFLRSTVLDLAFLEIKRFYAFLLIYVINVTGSRCTRNIILGGEFW